MEKCFGNWADRKGRGSEVAGVQLDAPSTGKHSGVCAHHGQEPFTVGDDASRDKKDRTRLGRAVASTMVTMMTRVPLSLSGTDRFNPERILIAFGLKDSS